MISRVQNLQELVIKACKGEAYKDQLKAVLDIYKADLSRLELEAQLPLLKPLCKDICKEMGNNVSALDAVRVLSVAQRTAFSGVWTILKLLLVLPATNATSERSFSALRRPMCALYVCTW